MEKQKRSPRRRRLVSISRKKFFLLTFIPFILIIIAGGIGFVLSMRTITREASRAELLPLTDVQRINLEQAIANEINVVLQMAASPIIRDHFIDPTDETLRIAAFAELDRLAIDLRSRSVFWIADADHTFHLTGGTNFLFDPSLPQNNWYNTAMHGARFFNVGIYHTPQLGVTNLWINAPVVAQHEFAAQPVGIVGTGLNPADLINAMLLTHEDYNVRLYYFNHLGEITIARDHNLVHERVLISELFPDIGSRIMGWADDWAMGGVYALSSAEGEAVARLIPAIDWYVLAIQHLDITDYLGTNMTYLFLGIVAILLVFFILGQIGKRAFDIINRTRLSLRVERDVISTMKDNLDSGIFLMNKDLLIQGAYSKALEEILGTSEIEGKSFAHFLGSSFSGDDLISLDDYFEMILNRQFNNKKLNDLNPIAEFVYVNPHTKEEKTIKTVFSPVDMGDGVIFVLASLNDISRMKELELQLKEETNKRDAEVDTLFQILRIEPGQFEEFMSSSGKEFERINTVLKDKELSSAEAMTKVFQSVHSVKSNALILGLDNFKTKLHNLETTIRKHQDAGTEDDNSLQIVIELESILKERDKYQQVVDKMGSFIRTPNQKSFDSLLETLNVTSKKVADETGKKVKLTSNFDSSLFKEEQKQTIREVLIQLIRNSVYHGIETPDERAMAAKDETGNITLETTKEDGNVIINLTDDGRGIDFEMIREKGLRQNLIKEEDSHDQNKLIKLLFFPNFSTAGSVNEHAGRGVGLDLVKERIRELGGNIKIGSKKGRGTTFVLSVPVDSAAV